MLEALLLLLPYSASSACCSLPRKSEGLHCIAFFLTSVQSYQVPRSFPSSPSTSFLTSSHLISFQLIALLSYFLSLWLLSSPEPTFLSFFRSQTASFLFCFRPVLSSTRLDSTLLLTTTFPRWALSLSQVSLVISPSSHSLWSILRILLSLRYFIVFFHLPFELLTLG